MGNVIDSNHLNELISKLPAIDLEEEEVTADTQKQFFGSIIELFGNLALFMELFANYLETIGHKNLANNIGSGLKLDGITMDLSKIRNPL